jgi:8-oxo-dGTP pyrophosphatase MutT (NUDIX family)
VTLGHRLARAGLTLYRWLPGGVRRRLIRWWAPSFTVGTICAVFDGDQVLLVRHSYRRHWGAPGGLLDRGEAPEATAVREVREEVDLAVMLEAPPRAIVWPKLRRVDLAYRCKPVADADVTAVRAASPEIVEARWFPVTALPTLQADTARAFRELGVIPPFHRTPTAAPSARTDAEASSVPSPRSGEPVPE